MRVPIGGVEGVVGERGGQDEGVGQMHLWDGGSRLVRPKKVGCLLHLYQEQYQEGGLLVGHQGVQ